MAAVTGHRKSDFLYLRFEAAQVNDKELLFPSG